MQHTGIFSPMIKDKKGGGESNFREVLSEIETFGIHPRQVGSRNALRDICNVIEAEIEPELEKVESEGVKAGVAILKEVSCGYGLADRGGRIEEEQLEHHITRLEDYNAQPKPEALSATEQDALLNICHIMDSSVEPIAEKVMDIRAPKGKEGARDSPHSVLYLSTQAVGCSVDAIKKIACGLGFENEKPNIRVEVDCLKQFTAAVRRFDYPGR